MNNCENRGSRVRVWLAYPRGVYKDNLVLPSGLQGMQELEAYEAGRDSVSYSGDDYFLVSVDHILACFQILRKNADKNGQPQNS